MVTETADLSHDYLATVAPQLWAKATKGAGCWEYGSGSPRHKRFKGMSAHRAAWIIINGPIPDGLHVCHHCDNPPCVRPDHLFLGTNSDNMQDMIAKGRGQGRPVRGLYELSTAAKSLGVASSTLRHQLRNGRLAGIKFDRRWLIPDIEVERYRSESLRSKSGVPE